MLRCRHAETQSPALLRRLPAFFCPIANTLDILGDKWTLLVARDLLFLGKRLYGDFMQSPEGIPSNILADRLRRLEEARLVTRRPYQDNPVRHEYRLTEKGRDLYPILKEMARWGSKHVAGTYAPPAGFFDELEKRLAAPKPKQARKKR